LNHRFFEGQQMCGGFMVNNSDTLGIQFSALAHREKLVHRRKSSPYCPTYFL